jgi:hypothetical protein
MRALHLMGSRSQRPPHRENRKASCMKCMRYSRALPRETLLAQAISRSGASWPASRAPAGDESRRRSHHASALQIQVSSSALPYYQNASPPISSLPPDCTRAATVTVSERSEDLHVIAVLLTPRHHCIYPAAYISAIHTSPPRTIAQEASSLVGPRSRGSNLFTSHRAHALG